MPSLPLSTRTLAGIRREGRGRGKGQVTGISFTETQFLAKQVSKKGVKGVRDAAMYSLMSDCLLRIGEAVNVRMKDIEAASDGSGRLSIPPEQDRPGR